VDRYIFSDLFAKYDVATANANGYVFGEGLENLVVCSLNLIQFTEGDVEHTLMNLDVKKLGLTKTEFL
jgi:hypothetical protein